MLFHQADWVVALVGPVQRIVDRYRLQERPADFAGVDRRDRAPASSGNLRHGGAEGPTRAPRKSAAIHPSSLPPRPPSGPLPLGPGAPKSRAADGWILIHRLRPTIRARRGESGSDSSNVKPQKVVRRIAPPPRPLRLDAAYPVAARSSASTKASMNRTDCPPRLSRQQSPAGLLRPCAVRRARTMRRPRGGRIEIERRGRHPDAFRELGNVGKQGHRDIKIVVGQVPVGFRGSRLGARHRPRGAYAVA